MKYLKIALAVLLALLPSILKIPLYRWLLHYDIGKDVRIGLTLLAGIEHCKIGDGVRIGHLNCFYKIHQLKIGDFTRIGFLNLFRGGQTVSLGAYSTILRQNTFNSIVNPEVVNPNKPILELGNAVFVASGHWLDFTDKITLGDNTIIGGRNSSFWTHNRQRTRSISVGCNCYLGSEIRVAPGVQIAPFCIVALGSVLMGKFDSTEVLIAGNPATIIRPLEESDMFLIHHKTRADIPDEEESKHHLEIPNI
jgi:acetyltransferase-like isoleucine patch superfamily enzyme